MNGLCFFFILVLRQVWPLVSVVSMALVALMCSFCRAPLFSLLTLLFYLLLLLLLRSSKGALSRLETDFFCYLFVFVFEIH